MWFPGGSLDLNYVWRGGGIQNLGDGSKFQPPLPLTLNNERSLSSVYKRAKVSGRFHYQCKNVKNEDFWICSISSAAMNLKCFIPFSNL